MKWLLFAVVLLVELSSCTIEKRMYRPGYSIEWRSHNKFNKFQEENLPLSSIKAENPLIIAETHQSIAEIEKMTESAVMDVTPISVAETKEEPKNVQRKLLKSHHTAKSHKVMQSSVKHQLPAKKQQVRRTSDDGLIMTALLVFSLIVLGLIGCSIWAFVALSSPALGIILLTMAVIMIIVPLLILAILISHPRGH